MRDFIPIAELQKDHAPFQDANVKLAVLDALMQSGQLDLGDRFAFWERLTAGSYDYEQDGYVLKPAFLSYLRQYPLTKAHLEAVEVLYFDGGLDIYAWIFPFWGGETEDFDIRSLRDLALLPNLRVFEFSAMVQSNNLAPLAKCLMLEEVGLGLIGKPWQNWPALLELPRLRRLQVFKYDLGLGADAVLQTLTERGVRVQVY